MSVAHLKGYRQLEGVEVVAVCNPSGRRLDGDLSDVEGNVGDQQPIRLDMTRVTPYQDFDAFLRHPGLQVVDICTPTRTHVDLSSRALRAGYHVLCEKPLARFPEEVRQLSQEVGKAKGIFMPAMCLRFWPEWAWLKEAIDSLRYGEVRAAQFRRIAEPPAWGQANYFKGDESGGALLDLHVHDVDFIHYCFGKPIRVYSQGFSAVSGAVDHVTTQYTVSSGACVSAEGSWAMTPGFGFNMAYTVIFEKATVVYDLSRGDESLVLYPGDDGREVIRCQGKDGYAGQLEYFLECIRKDVPPSKVSIEDGLAVSETCFAEEQSIKSDQVVNVSRREVTPTPIER